MDAKPIRALRIRDENAPPQVPAGKVVHQRNKSTSALAAMAQAGGLKAPPAKRKVFADVSNTVRQPAANDDARGSKSAQLDVLKDSAAVSAKEQNKANGLLKPAQRPLSAIIVKSDAAKHNHTDPSLLRKVLSKKATTVFKETQSDPIAEVLKASHDVVSAPVPTRQPLAARSKSRPNIEHGPIPIETEAKLLPVEAVVSHAPTDRQVHRPLRDAPAPVGAAYMPVVDKIIPVDSEVKYSAVELEVQESYEYVDALEEQARALENERNEELAKSHALAQLEQEEYWDEDEDEEYFDADGYTTARSRGENTTGGVTLHLAPKITAKSQRELEAAKVYVETHKTTEDIEDEQWDTSMVAEYSEEIFEYMRELEEKMRPNPTYMVHQSEIQWSMRSVLMDWLVQVHNRFTLLPETLFLSVNYVDRFLSCKVVSLGKLQLVGATALFVAAKYEEINCPSVQEIVYMVDGAYTVDEILKAERFMLSMLQFELGWPGPMSFLRRISKADDYDLETRTLAKYFLEITVMDERFVGCSPSYLAAGAHCLARFMLKKGDWTQAHVHYSGYTLTQLRHLVSVMLECCDNPEKHHAAIYEKYTDKRYKRASIFVGNELAKGFELPSASRDSFAGNSLAGHGLAWKRK